MRKNLKIAYITENDPWDKRPWSGTFYKMHMALRKRNNVIPLGPLNFGFWRLFIITIQKLTAKVLRKKYNSRQSIILSLYASYILKRKLSKEKFDLIFAPAGSKLIALLKTDVPIFYYSDATVNLMIDYYEIFTNLAKFSIKESNYIEKKTIQNASACIYASDWAARDAIKTYNAKPENTHVIKLGANIEAAPEKINIEKKLIQTTCTLLFLGVDWERKGGNIVIQTLEILLSEGFDARLIVCGCIPPITHPNMQVHKFLDKNKDADYKLFTEILENAHFLFLPTRAECAGIVFCEASANGIPSIASNTGGVTSYVQDGINGYALPLTATPKEYAKIIKETFMDKKLYQELSYKSREKYENELNWDTWEEQMNFLIEKLVKKG